MRQCGRFFYLGFTLESCPEVHKKMSIEKSALVSPEPSESTRQVGGAWRTGGPLLKGAARTRSAAMPVVSQRNLTKLMKAAQACGVASYEITYEQTGQIRFAVGGVRQAGMGPVEGAEPNDFDSEFG
jgi:hypothetical protein